MQDTSTLLAAAASAIVAMIWLSYRRTGSKMPPGPNRFSLMLRKKEMSEAPREFFTSLRATYGAPSPCLCCMPLTCLIIDYS